ncbi:MAG: HutD family protein [Actinomycetales bacterium]
MEIVRYAELPPARWANGGGTTRVLASKYLGDGDAAELQWRLSIAEVAAAGPFSAYPGLDRILTVVAGELVLLTIDGAEQPLERYRPHKFSGDSEAGASLPTGPVMDLNVMTRRGAYRGFTTILELSKKRPHPVFEGQFAVLLEGRADVGAPPGADGGATAPAEGRADDGGARPTQVLGRYDTVVGSAEAPEILGRGFLAVVTIEAL